MDKLDKVDPVLVAKVQKILVAMSALGLQMKVIQGYRTPEYQHSLWLQGRAEDGSVVNPKLIVTNCDGYKVISKHQSGRAVDCVFVDGAGKILWDGNQPWDLYGRMGRVLGLVWGGDFKMRDLDHLELP